LKRGVLNQVQGQKEQRTAMGGPKRDLVRQGGRGGDGQTQEEAISGKNVSERKVSKESQKRVENAGYGRRKEGGEGGVGLNS